MQPSVLIVKNLKKLVLVGIGLCCFQLTVLVYYSLHREHCRNICKVIQINPANPPRGSMRTYLQNDQGQFDSIRTTVKTRLSTSTEQKKVFDKPTFKSFQTTTMERKRENWKPNFKAFQTTTTQDSPPMERKNKNWSPTFKASQNTIPQDSSIPSSTESSPTPEKTRTCTKQSNNTLRGKLNLHLWYGSCGYSIDDGVRKSHQFPRRPHVETTISTSESEPKGDKYSQRIFGYLHPEINGTYQFAVSSDDASELWLSNDDSTKNIRLIAFIGQVHQLLGDFTFRRQYNRLKSQISKPIRLSADRAYYIELLHRQNGQAGHATVAWRREGADKDFALIEPRLLSPYFAEGMSVRNTSSEHVECIMTNHSTLPFRKEPLMKESDLDDIRDDYCHKVPTLEHKEVADILPSCPYSPTYMPNKKLTLFQGTQWASVFARSAVYPSDHTWFYTTLNKSDVDKGNQFLDEREAKGIVEEYVSALKKHVGGRAVFNRIINVEGKKDGNKGNRYLIEMELLEKTEKGISHPIRLSEYVYKFTREHIARNKGNVSEGLCYPQGFQWRRNVEVYFVVTVRNMGHWIKYLIDELCHLYQNSPEKNFHLVVVDFNSSDFNIENYLSKSVLSNRSKVVKMSGVFFKTAAYNTGVATIQDPNSIVFLTDLHLTMPANLIDSIRKHTIKGKSAYFPLLLRLACGSNTEYPRGGWENQGYGLFGVYKEDWDRMGGMNTIDFKDRWGGEDWELLDRTYNAKLEPERLCVSKLYHFYHDRKGDWYKEDELPLYEQNKPKTDIPTKKVT